MVDQEIFQSCVGQALFDVAQDSAETRDLAAKHPEIYQSLRKRIQALENERRQPEIHTKITTTIETPLLVFGKEENANPSPWLAPYIKAIPPSAKELRRLKNRSKNN